MRDVLGLVLALAPAVLTASGCARRPHVVIEPAPPPPQRDDLYVVLSSAEGNIGAVTVTHGSEQAVLDRAYAAARIAETGRLEVGQSAAQEVRQVFGAALDARPRAPTSLTLFFTFGTDELTPDSQQAVAQVMTEITSRPAAEVIVIGHTDRVGTTQQNDVLSLQRAQRIRDHLVNVGISGHRIQTAGRGEREPLVPTEDEVPEPRNRRVEIAVR